MKKLFLFVLVGIALLLTPTNISAHTLKTDGSIGAVIHIDPEDDPIVGEPASFYFEFKDTEGKFKPADCSCLFTISKDGQELFSEQLETDSEDPSLTNSSFSFTFPEKGVYQIKVTGNSINAVSFDPFELTYDLRVDRTSGATGQSFVEKNIHFFLLGGILLVFLAVFFSNRIKRNKPDSSATPKLILLVLLISFALASHNTHIDRVVFFHHDQTHDQTDHPCCRPYDIALINSPILINPITLLQESLNPVRSKYLKFAEITNSSRSPPSFA